MMFDMADDGNIEIIQTVTYKGSKKYFAQLTDNGQDFLMQNFDAAIDTYRQHVELTIQAMKERHNEKYAPRQMSKKEREALAAGQKVMFSND